MRINIQKISNMGKERISNDIPIEAVLKQTLIENGKLRSEIEYLESELCRLKDAVAAFKVWQGKVATYKWQYWLNEGIAMASEKPDEATRKRLVTFLSRHAYYNRFTAKYQRMCDRHDCAAEMLIKS